jgi:hypothetical protein
MPRFDDLNEPSNVRCRPLKEKVYKGSWNGLNNSSLKRPKFIYNL